MLLNLKLNKRLSSARTAMWQRAGAVLFACLYLAGSAGGAVEAKAASMDTAGDASETTRIVSLVPNLTELTFTVGAGGQVVGVSDYCRYPAEAMDRPAVGGLVNPSLEGVLQLKPTVVLLYRSQADFAARLQKLGVRTELFQVDTLADLYAAIGRVGLLTGNGTEARELADRIRVGLDEVRVGVLGAVGDGSGTGTGSITSTGTRTGTGISEARRVRGVVIVSRDPAGLRNLFQASNGNFLGELFEIAGGELAVSGGADVSLEEVIRADPELIIDMSGSATGGGELGEKPDPAPSEPDRGPGPWAALSTVDAVKRNRVYQWNDPHVTLLGPSVVETARQMRKLVDEAAKGAR